MVATLEKENEIIKPVSTDKQPQVIEVLMQCQKLAIEIGNDIESRGKAGGALIKVLEDYCEAIYQQSLMLSDDNLCSKYKKKIRNLLKKVSDGIEFELPQDRMEMVFFPYMASMWDSFESVWMAAKDDENCDAYVVPIPYFDKNPDGSFGKMHYEGDNYPAYVPVTPWQEYDIEKRRPDTIFIHNPYDGVNYVTSVHPEYYAKKLKKYTDNLVYIPYFVLQEILPDDQEAIEEMKHFCFLPGTIYADKVIVQSESMKQIYINEFLKAAQQCRLSVDRRKLERKFLGLGSPKFDKVLNTKKEDILGR